MGSYDFDIAGLRRETARRSRVTRGDEEQAFSERYLSVQPTLDGMSWRIHGRLTGAAGSIVHEALTARAEGFGVFPDGTRAPLSQRRADALVAICQDTASPSGGGGGSVTVFVDATEASATNAETGVTVAGGPRVGLHTLEAVLCDGTVEVTAVTADGTPLGIGRTSRVVPPRLRRFVLHRDGGCVADGCDSTYRLQAHHRVPFSQGGRTDPDNLVTLCWFHHHVVIHGHGFSIDPDSKPGRVRFRPPRGSPRDPPPWNL